MQLDRKIFIDAGINYIYELDEYAEGSVSSQVAKELDDVLALNDPAVLQKRQEYFGVGTAQDYLNRTIETDEGYVLAGIRHLGSNKNKPFVYIWPSFNIESIKAIAQSIKPHFQLFKPESLSYWSRPDSNDSKDKIFQQRFIARTTDMPKSDLPLSTDRDYFDWYESEYQEFHRENPQLANRIQANSKALMTVSSEQGLLYVLNEGGSRVGMIAGENDTFLYKPAVYLNELLIAKGHRGRGYAGKLLAGFVSRLNADYFICDIDADNIPSTKTALRSGLKVFSQEIFVRI